MIALLNCFTSYSQIDTIHSSTGRLEDSVLVAYNDLRKVNAKLVELNYEKQINSKLRDIIYNDSIVIDVASSAISKLSEDNTKLNKKIKRQRKCLIAGGAGIGALLIFAIIK